MIVELGNDSAVEMDRAARPRRLSGQRVTRFSFPKETTPLEAMAQVVAVWSDLVAGDEEGTPMPPRWIESDDRSLVVQLCKRWGIKVKESRRPGDWGSHAH